MHAGHTVNWAQRLPPTPHGLFDTFADLHPVKSSSSNSPNHQLSSPADSPSSRPTSAPTSPLLNPSVASKLPSGTNFVSAIKRSKASPSRLQRPFSSYSIKTDDISLKNIEPGGPLSSPTYMPYSRYPSYSSTVSQHASTTDEIGDYVPFKSPYGDPPTSGVMSMTRSNSGNKSRRPQPSDQVQPVYHLFSGPSTALPPRSISFAGPPSTRLVNTIEPSPTLPPELLSNNRFVSSANFPGRQVIGSKSTKNGIKNRLRGLRRKQRSNSRDPSAYITSGESDSEPPDTEQDTIVNTGGISHMLMPSVGGSSRSSTFTRPRLPYNDSGLPPQLPPRNNYMNGTFNSNNNASSGQGKGYVSGPEHGSETQKESSTVRFKGLLKSVGLSNQHSPNTPPLTRDCLSDDQPGSKVFSLKRPERRKKRIKKPRFAAAGVHATLTIATDDEDSSASKSAQHNHHSHRRFWNPRRRSRSIDLGVSHHPIVICNQEPINQGPIISAALKEAREGNRDPNVLVAELEPLPPSFKDAFAVLSHPRAPQQQQRQQQQQQQQHPQPQLYALMAPHIPPSSTVGPAFASVCYGPTGTLTNYQYIPTPQRSPVGGCSSVIGTKTFLFQSLENSRLQGHYIFRVVGDNIEYKKLPPTLEQSSSQYFRSAWKTYRSLEETWREEQEQKGIDRPWVRDLDLGNRIDRSAPLSVTIPRPTRNYSQMNNELGRRGSEGTILKSAVAWDQLTPTGLVSMTESPVSTPTLPVSNSGYLIQRYNPQISDNPALRSIVDGISRSNSDPIGKGTAAGFYENGGRNGSTLSQITLRSALYHSRRRSWSSVSEQQHSEQQKQQAIEEANWREKERKFREEFQQATFGLELFLKELVKGSEYEIFDTAANVTISDENRKRTLDPHMFKVVHLDHRDINDLHYISNSVFLAPADSAVFTIINSDRTNIMCLESPSVKLKGEFLNWIKISTMGHEEVEDVLIPAPQAKLPTNSSLNFLIANLDSYEEKSEGVDLIRETVELRIKQQADRLQAMRENFKITQKEIERCIHRLDEMNERAKETMTNIARDIDSQEIQLALRPSPATGMTLAATVEKKVIEVQERIMVCQRIMDEASNNLLRLRNEIELEQRSIRLFRQYKIIIAVAATSVVFLAWFLYHSRANPLGPQPPSPLFPESTNPIEVNHRYRHEGISVSTPSISTPTIFTHESVNIVEYEPELDQNYMDFGIMEEIDIEDKDKELSEKTYEATVTDDILSDEEFNNLVETPESSLDEVFGLQTHGNVEQPLENKSLLPLELERETEECVVNSDLLQISSELEPAASQKYCITHS
ncbi:hypothetical protein BGX20_011287 [Mortierella sp. AD010]|nr:hypothetical protein BGX20_011287 [Mortierella sp. AD010]